LDWSRVDWWERVEREARSCEGGVWACEERWERERCREVSWEVCDF
jgi:hypothetical protein